MRIEMHRNPLRAYREARNMSQPELAKILGCTPGMVSHVETGKRKVSPQAALEWEQIIGIPRHELRPDIFGARA